MLRRALVLVSISLLTGCAGNLIGEQKGFFHTLNFKALTESANTDNWNPASPWKLPQAFKQTRVSAENNLNIYDAGRNDIYDMNTVNETGADAGRYLYTTHEVRNTPEGGAISVVDLQTGQAKVLVQNPGWSAVDGVRWTPWGTLVFAEEKTAGRFFEIILDTSNPTKVLKVIERPAVGNMSHEGIDIDKRGNIYIVDEHHGRSLGCNGIVPCGGGIYKFVPKNYGDLSSGSLYVLGIKQDTRRDNLGQGQWLGPIDPARANVSGSEMGGASYQRPEDIEIINNTLYVAITEGPRDEYDREYYDGRVIAINLETLSVTNFVKPGVNVPVETGEHGLNGYQSGFDNIDNLAESPDGELIMIEDNVPSDIWIASTKKDKFGYSKRVKLFASLTDPAAEGTGIYFSPQDPDTLYVNVQHSVVDDGDGTWAIRHKNNIAK